MPDEPPVSSDPYKDILAQPGSGISVHPDINLGLPKMRDAFNRAAKGEEVVDQSLTNDLLGAKTTLYRSNPADKTEYDFTPDIAPVIRLAQIRATQRPLTAEENKAYEQGVQDIVKKTGMTEDHLRTRLAEAETEMKDEEKDVLGKFSSVDSDLQREIGEQLAKRVRTGGLPPAEEAKLQDNLKKFGEQNGFDPEDVTMDLIKFQSSVTTHDLSMAKASTESLNEAGGEIKKGFGAYYKGDYMNVVKFDPANKAYEGFGFTDKDPPGRAPPLTKEQVEFMIALHESEHGMAMAGRHEVFTPALRDDVKAQALEIDADSAVVKFMNDTGEKAGKDYWLQSRNVKSFTDGLAGDLSHDTATFLRIQEKTGQQIDLAKFRDEKSGLIKQIADRFEPTTKIDSITTGQTMGAVTDLLKDDREHPEKKLLSPVQKAEAEQYLADADALGFKADPNYPKPAAGAAPVPPTSQPAQPVGPRPQIF